MTLVCSHTTASAGSLFIAILLLLPACEGMPPTRDVGGAEVALVPELARTWLVRGQMSASVATMDDMRVLRLYRLLFRDGLVREEAGETVLMLDSAESASAFVAGARWVDGLVMTRRRENPPQTVAAGIAEAYRRFLMLDAANEPPDWDGLAEILTDDAVWVGSPNHAAMGAILFGSVVLAGETSPPARERALLFLTRAVAQREVPSWLSWIAYRFWRDHG